ncbi:hypothetical protein P1J78_15460 [Psychromarinibacter sp. C21-152]|uniref:Uncharacterized protein n=1 Tax=Psychromarinibacter sediminicola TaxID=3033385 RepID=A0AAE3NTI0_9RHOB|nr:hypothetical protein [Psychromarinibacter sediminicola]MDF0602136.1 hypothetical protein [Psychromarinibacter sediminicola]
MELAELSERRSNGQERITPLGYRTARRALPRVLAALPETDHRRIAAELVGNSVERIGAVKGASLEGTDSKGGQSDGGATTRSKHAARLHLVEAVANGWTVDTATGRIRRGPERVVFEVQRRIGERQEINAFPLLLAVCVHGRDLQDILRAHGWSVQSKYTRALGQNVLDMLDRVSVRLGG